MFVSNKKRERYTYLHAHFIDLFARKVKIVEFEDFWLQVSNFQAHKVQTRQKR